MQPGPEAFSLSRRPGMASTGLRSNEMIRRDAILRRAFYKSFPDKHRG